DLAVRLGGHGAGVAAGGVRREGVGGEVVVGGAVRQHPRERPGPGGIEAGAHGRDLPVGQDGQVGHVGGGTLQHRHHAEAAGAEGGVQPGGGRPGGERGGGDPDRLGAVQGRVVDGRDREGGGRLPVGDRDRRRDGGLGGVAAGEGDGEGAGGG